MAKKQPNHQNIIAGQEIFDYSPRIDAMRYLNRIGVWSTQRRATALRNR
jgi:hypothetical protein